jgi:RNA polymerase sigma factor (sigma-70 family)
MTMAYDAQDTTSDEALMVLYANGDRHAARTLAQRVTPRVLAYAARMLAGDRAEAEDVAQETMLRLWRMAPEWRQGETKVTTWAYRVATNLCIDRQRSRRRRGQVALDSVPDPEDGAPAAEARLQDRARLSALEAALAEMPDRQRQAVVLRHIEGLTNPEIAAVLEIGVEAVESLTARGKRALAALLAGQKAALGYGDDGDARHGS